MPKFEVIPKRFDSSSAALKYTLNLVVTQQIDPDDYSFCRVESNGGNCKVTFAGDEFVPPLNIVSGFTLGFNAFDNQNFMNTLTFMKFKIGVNLRNYINSLPATNMSFVIRKHNMGCVFYSGDEGYIFCKELTFKSANDMKNAFTGAYKNPSNFPGYARAHIYIKQPTAFNVTFHPIGIKEDPVHLETNDANDIIQSLKLFNMDVTKLIPADFFKSILKNSIEAYVWIENGKVTFMYSKDGASFEQMESN